MNLTDTINIIKKEIDNVKQKYFKDNIKLDECFKKTGINKQTLKNQKIKYKKYLKSTLQK